MTNTTLDPARFGIEVEHVEFDADWILDHWHVSQDGQALMCFANETRARTFAAELVLEQIEQGMVGELVSNETT